MPIEHYNACEAFSRGQLERSTCRILTQIGFTHANDSSLDLITDITRRYMQTMCSTVKWVAEHCGRSNVTLGDMEFVYDRMRISVAEMSLYMKQVRPLSPRHLPRFPASPLSKSDPVPLIKKSRSSDIPEWAPPGPEDMGALIQQSAAQTLDIPTKLDLPDFKNQTAFSLGLCKVDYQKASVLSKKNALARQPSTAPSTRPSSRNEILNNNRGEPVDRQIDLPKAAKIAELQGLSVQILSRAGTPLVSPAQKSNTGGSTPALPVFKRRITKRKSQDDSASPSPVPTSSNSQAQLARPRNESGGSSTLTELGRIPISANRNENKKITDTKMASFPFAPRSSGNLLTLASDLAREPRAVISAALSGRSATSHHEYPLPIPPTSTLNIRGPPVESETPKEIVQASILRSLFTPDCNMQREVQEALAFVKNIPPIPDFTAARHPQVSTGAPADRFSGSPAPAPLAQSSAHNSPAYEIIQSAQPVKNFGSLKIKLRRSSFGLPNADSPQNESKNMLDVSEDVQEDGEKKKKKKSKKDKKEKKKKKDKEDNRRSKEEAPADVADTSSPVCVPDNCGLKIKIKFGGPRP